MASKPGRRTFGRIRKLPSGLYQAGYVGPDLETHYAEHTFSAKIDAEAWLAAERALVEKPGWMAPKARRAFEEANRPPTVDEYAAGWIHRETSSRGPVRCTKPCWRSTSVRPLVAVCCPT